ncbi:MAG: bifunctional 3,4-dihydroxy-2-butanone-4-phosphate synthase/GTP cyclohydrolase II [Betaproteobacteria bacterium]|nr:bifunctional 3,4-dihydroxy-2-butanone-4-phosphate synthase/GTP cyclohydrolase II [Betaproteobacteria bacterium]
MSVLSPTHEIIEDIRIGKMVILIDEEDRENEGDIVLAAEHVTPEAINFMVKHARGLVCLTLAPERCKQLGLGLMVKDNRSQFATAFTASIEAAEGVTTGISAQDRARTVQAAVARHAKPEDIVQPGHIFPLMAQPGGVLVRAGHTEAGCDLAQLAGLEPAAVICEILKDDGTMARLPDLLEFAREHGLKIGAIRDLIEYRAHSETLVERHSDKTIETAHGPFQLTSFSDKVSGEVHLALSHGAIRPEVETLVRVHEPVSVLDFIDPADSHNHHTYGVDEAMRLIAANGHGALVLLRRYESGEEILERLAPSGARRPTSKWDPRLFGIGAQILRQLGVGKVRLLANPRRMPNVTGFGLEVTGYVSPAEN